MLTLNWSEVCLGATFCPLLNQGLFPNFIVCIQMLIVPPDWFPELGLCFPKRGIDMVTGVRKACDTTAAAGNTVAPNQEVGSEVSV